MPDAMLCYAGLSYSILCYSILCYALLCYSILFYSIVNRYIILQILKSTARYFSFGTISLGRVSTILKLLNSAAQYCLLLIECSVSIFFNRRIES